jgi:type VI protein secretion system component VasK
MLSWTYLVAAVLIIGAWTLVWVMHVTPKVGWLATAIIAVPFVVGFGRWLVSLVRTRQGLASAADGTAPSRSTGLDKLPELPVDGVDGSQLPRLPRYLVLGTSRAGRSALLTSSRVVARYAIPGASLTWWAGPGLVLAVAPGTLLDAPPWDRDEAPRSAGLEGVADGILVTFAVDELWDLPKAQLVERGRTLRALLNAIIQHAPQPVPVHVAVTKLDLLPGFRRAFAEHDARARALPWSFAIGDDASRASGELEALTAALDAFVAARLSAASGEPRERAAVLALLSSFEALGKRILWVLEGLCEPGLYSTKLRFRHVSLTSATQSGEVLGPAESWLGARRSNPLSHDEVPRPYFIGELFSRILPSDPLVVASAALRDKAPRGVTTWIAAAAVVVLSLGLAGWQGMHAITQQRELCEATRALRAPSGSTPASSVCARRHAWRGDDDPELSRVAERLDALCRPSR